MRLTTLPLRIGSIPQLVRNSTRAVEVASILSKYGLADWLSRLDLRIFRGLLKTQQGDQLALYSRATRVRLALTELGPTFIKLGQVLSTRPDLVGVELADELTHLQADVSAEPPDKVHATIQAELGASVQELFAEFDDAPLASGSIGQAHRACLKSGEQVVVKVQHTAIEAKIRIDLDILAGFADVAERIPEFQNYRPKATAAEFQRTLLRELDFAREERHLQEFAANFAEDPRVRIPRVHAEYSTSRVLTMEFLDGVPLTDLSRLKSTGVDLEEVARRGAELYMEMLFTHGFYHADPHPGNILVLRGNLIGLLDFGMVGRIDERLREDIEEMIYAIASRDPAHLTSVIKRVGQVPSGLDEQALNREITEFVANYASQPLDEFDLSSSLRDMTEIIRRYQIMLPAQIALLIKVLVMLEGTSRRLTPQFNLLDVILPYQQRMVWKRLSPRRQLRKLVRIYRDVELLAEVLPRGINDIFEQIRSGKFDVHLDHRGLEPSVNRLVLGMLASALFLGSSLLWSRGVPPLIYGVSVFGISGCTMSVLLGLRLLRAINKTGRLDRRP